MNKFVLFFTLLLPALANTQILFNEQDTDLGKISEAYEIKGDIILTNRSPKKVFLMRADADRGVMVYTSKKVLLPDDTCLLVISFIPENSGKFKKKINLVATDRETPYEITLSGNLANVRTNDRMACVYFGKRKNNSVQPRSEPVVIPVTSERRDNSNKLPGSSPVSVAATAGTFTPRPTVSVSAQSTTAPQDNPEFSELNFKPNNILFLVDVSSSMRDSLKLPLMKNALHKLIDVIREIDTITFVTYASKVKILQEAVSGADKKTLHSLVDSLKAKGMTSGKTAILFSQQLAQKHFIQDGNNQIIIATDGEFKFVNEDYKIWKAKQQHKEIVLTTVAFGNDKAAIKNLKEIASKGGGSFIQVDSRSGSEVKLLDEIKDRSRK